MKRAEAFNLFSQIIYDLKQILFLKTTFPQNIKRVKFDPTMLMNLKRLNKGSGVQARLKIRRMRSSVVVGRGLLGKGVGRGEIKGLTKDILSEESLLQMFELLINQSSAINFLF
jgi:hypothetical protein